MAPAAGMRRNSQTGAEALPDAAEAQRSDDKQFTTKAEYNRWLVRQENAKMAEETRKAAKVGDDIIKERTRTHTARGLSRQQAAMVQMKRASESLEAHRQQNLQHGRKVYEEVQGWRVGAKETKDSWVSYGKSIKDAQRAQSPTGAEAAMMELKDKKLKAAATTRADDQAKEAERERQKKEREKEVKAAADEVRKATSDEVTDGAKRVFFEQRLKAATETKTQGATLDKQRKENDVEFKESQAKKRNYSRSMRDFAAKSKEKLLSTRASNAASLREARKGYSEQHKQRMQEEYLEKAATVKGVIANSIYNEADALSSPPGSPPRSPKALTSGRSPGSRGQYGDMEA